MDSFPFKRRPSLSLFSTDIAGETAFVLKHTVVELRLRAYAKDYARTELFLTVQVHAAIHITVLTTEKGKRDP